MRFHREQSNTSINRTRHRRSGPLRAREVISALNGIIESYVGDDVTKNRVNPSIETV
jgi:hypothetical protein